MAWSDEDMRREISSTVERLSEQQKKGEIYSIVVATVTAPPGTKPADIRQEGVKVMTSAMCESMCTTHMAYSLIALAYDIGQFTDLDFARLVAKVLAEKSSDPDRPPRGATH